MLYRKILFAILSCFIATFAYASISVNDSGSWKTPTAVWVNDSGSWKQATEVWVNNAGVWTLALSGASSNLCYLFDSGDDYVNTTVNTRLTGYIEVRFKLTSLSDGILAGTMNSTYGARGYIGIRNGYLAAGIGSQSWTTITGITSLSTGTDYIGRVSWDGTDVILTLDGSEEYNATQSGTPDTSIQTYVGAVNRGGTLDFDVSARIWNVKLASQSGGVYTVENQYLFDEGSGTTATDNVGTSDGVINTDNITTFHSTY